jgi:hypothetical protein
MNKLSLFLLWGILIFININLNSQERIRMRTHETKMERINFSAGAGFTELINAGLRYQFLDQHQAGLSVGYLPFINESAASVAGHYTRHFAGFTELSERYPWYLRGGLNYNRSESSFIIDRYFFANIRIGRDFNFSRRFGIELDSGVTFRLFHDETIKTPGGGGYKLGIFRPVYPSFSMAVFYRITRL